MKRVTTTWIQDIFEKAHGVQADDNNFQGQNETGDGELTDGILAFLLDGTGLLGVVLGAWVVAGSTSSLEEEEKESEVVLGSVCVSGIILWRAGSVQGGGWIVKVKILKTQGNNNFFFGGGGGGH